jgi:MFS transporter, ACS family, glucarate transporter
MGTLSNQSASLRPTRVRYGVLGFACSLALLTYLDRIVIMQANESIKSDLGFSDKDMGLIFSAFIIGYLLLEVPGGWMGDRWGSRRVLAGIVLAWSLFTALTSCVWAFTLDSGRQLYLGSLVIPLALNSLAMMLLIRFLFGLGEAGAFPNVTRVIRNWFPLDERAFALGLVWTFARLGGALAPLALSFLTVMLGWRQAFWMLGLLGAVWAVIFYLRFRDRPEDHPLCNDAELALIRQASTPLESSDHEGLLPESSRPSQQVTIQQEGVTTAKYDSLSPQRVAIHGATERLARDVGHAWPSWRILVGSVTVWAVCAASFFINLGWYFYATWQPKYWQEVHNIPYTESGWLTGAPFVCGAVGTLLGGFGSDLMLRRGISRRWSRALIGIAGYLLAGLCMLATGFTTTVWQAETLLCLAFLVNDLTVPIIWAVCTDVGGHSAGALSGLMNMVGGIGAVISPALLPHAHELLHVHFDHRLCWRIIFAGLASSWFLGAFAWLFIDAGKPLQSASEPEA